MSSSESPNDIVTAALLIIGDEILSGRTKDKNIGYIAEYLTAIGIDLSEVRVVPDVESRIVSAVNELRSALLREHISVEDAHDSLASSKPSAALLSIEKLSLEAGRLYPAVPFMVRQKAEMPLKVVKTVGNFAIQPAVVSDGVLK